jgi:hypothetical protein
MAEGRVANAFPLGLIKLEIVYSGNIYTKCQIASEPPCFFDNIIDIALKSTKLGVHTIKMNK